MKTLAHLLALSAIAWLLALPSPSNAQDNLDTQEAAIPQPPSDLDGFERARWFYRLISGPLADSEREERLREAEEDFWRRVDEILSADYPAPTVETQPEALAAEAEIEVKAGGPPRPRTPLRMPRTGPPQVNPFLQHRRPRIRSQRDPRIARCR